MQKKKELDGAQGVKRKQQEKLTQPKKKKKHRIQKPIVQVCQATCSIVQTSTSTSTRHNVFVDETSVNEQKEHIVVDKSGPVTGIRNLMAEFHGVKITKVNRRQTKETMQNDGEQKDAIEKLHTLKRTQQHKTTYPQKTQET